MPSPSCGAGSVPSSVPTAFAPAWGWGALPRHVTHLADEPRDPARRYDRVRTPGRTSTRSSCGSARCDATARCLERAIRRSLADDPDALARFEMRSARR